MSLSFARKLNFGYNIDHIDTNVSGAIVELKSRPGVFYQVDLTRLRCSYYGLGQVAVGINFAPPGQPP